MSDPQRGSHSIMQNSGCTLLLHPDSPAHTAGTAR